MDYKVIIPRANQDEKRATSAKDALLHPCAVYILGHLKDPK